MATTAIPTDDVQVSREHCPECGIYFGCHRMNCSRLDWEDPVAVKAAEEVDAFLEAQYR